MLLLLLLLQVKHPATDLPIGIVGSLLICGFLYALMCGTFLLPSTKLIQAMRAAVDLICMLTTICTCCCATLMLLSEN